MSGVLPRVGDVGDMSASERSVHRFAGERFATVDRPSDEERFVPPALSELPSLYAQTMSEHDPEAPVPRFRKSWFQGLLLSGGWLDDGGNDGLGISHAEVQLRSGIPLEVSITSWPSARAFASIRFVVPP